MICYPHDLKLGLWNMQTSRNQSIQIIQENLICCPFWEAKSSIMSEQFVFDTHPNIMLPHVKLTSLNIRLTYLTPRDILYTETVLYNYDKLVTILNIMNPS